jgi:hypothetical protein
MQRSVRGATAKDVKIDVQAALASAPIDATEATVWIDVLLSAAEGYVPLIEAGKIPLNRAEVYKG